MSGGSFDYVYMDMSDPEWSQRAKPKLAEMKAYCEQHHPEVVSHIEDMLQFIYSFDTEYLKRGERIAHLLKAVEWHVSSDWSADAITEALTELKDKPDNP